MPNNIIISNKTIGVGHPIFFIAEAGVNHNGSIDLAKQLIDEAKICGADAIKFQTFKANKLNTKKAPKSSYHIQTTGDDLKQSWYELLKTQEITYDMHVELIEYCNKKNIIFLSTPYDVDSLHLLNELNVEAFKIASTDTNNLPFLTEVAKLSKPTIISTAFCNFTEVQEAVNTLKKSKLEDIIVCQCTGNYPSKLEDSNLRVLKKYADELECLIGYSDHTEEYINPIAAVPYEICLYEKHFTLDKKLNGPDHRMSLEPKELKKTIELIRLAEKTLGSFDKKVLADEEENRIKLRKSLVASQEIAPNTIIEKKMIDIKRPGSGIQPKDLDNILGKKIKNKKLKDEIFFKDDFE